MSKVIVLVSYYFPPQNEIACLRVGQWAKYLAKAGRRVIVLTAKKSIADGVMDLSIDLPEEVQVIEVEFVPKWFVRLLCKLRGASLVRISPGLQPPPEKSFPFSSSIMIVLKAVYRSLSRLMGSLFDYRIIWAIKAVKPLREVCAKNNVCCIVSSYGPAASHLAVFRALQGTGHSTRWIMDFRDPWAGSHITGARFPFSVIETKLQNEMIAKHAYALTTVSGELLAEFNKQFPDIPTHLIQNGVDIAQYRSLGLGIFATDWAASKAQFPGLCDGVFRIVYTGMIYCGTRNPAPLFRAIKNIRKNPSIKIVVEFFGKPGDLDAIVRSEGAEDFVVHRGIVSHHESLQIQSNADLLLILETENANAVGVLTGKIFEYLASGRPILAVGVDAVSAIGRLLESTSAGVALGNDAEMIEKELSGYLKLGSHPTYRLREEDLEFYSRERQTNSLLALIDRAAA